MCNCEWEEEGSNCVQLLLSVLCFSRTQEECVGGRAGLKHWSIPGKCWNLVSYQSGILKRLFIRGRGPVSWGKDADCTWGKDAALSSSYQSQSCVLNLDKRNLCINPTNFLRRQLMKVPSYVTWTCSWVGEGLIQNQVVFKNIFF